MTDSPRFALLRLDREAHDPMALARALAEIRGTPVQDQVLEAKRAWGIVAEDLPEDEAKALGKALRSAGVECAVGPRAALAELPDARPARSIDAVPDAPPRLVAVAGVTVTSTRTRTVEKGPGGAAKVAGAALTMTTGLPIRVGGKKRKAQRTEEEETLVFVADLCYDGPEGRVRVEASDFDFSCLGGRMLYQAQGNLKLLVGDVVEGAPDAWLNHGTRVLLEGRPIRTMGYASLDDLEREERWLLTLRAAG